MTTIATVNKELKRLGHKERLRRGKGYFYFAEGNAASWHSSGVYVHSASELTLEQWVQERKRLSEV